MLVPVLVLIVVMGVYPRPFLNRMEPSVEGAAWRAWRPAQTAERAAHRARLTGVMER